MHIGPNLACLIAGKVFLTHDLSVYIAGQVWRVKFVRAWVKLVGWLGCSEGTQIFHRPRHLHLTNIPLDSSEIVMIHILSRQLLPWRSSVLQK